MAIVEREPEIRTQTEHPADLPGPGRGNQLLIAACVSLLVVAVIFRVWRLDALPGVNGDEAWYGVQAQRLVSGEPVAWRTPTGNPLNPFFFGPQVLMAAIAAPSFWLLRLPALVSGLLALGVNYWFCRRLFDRTTAVTSTLILAILPINVIYSRLAWDASQSLLATLLVMYLPLCASVDPVHRRRWYVAAVLALGVAILVHPTNVFATPLLVTPLFTKRGKTIDWSSDRSATSGVLWLPRLTGYPSPIHFAAIFVVAVLGAWLLWPWLAIAATRLVNPTEYTEFAAGFVQLISGVTSLRYVTGTDNGLLSFILNGATLLALGLSAWGAYQITRMRHAHLEWSLAIGWSLMLVTFFLIAGPGALSPHWERYAICLIAPTVLLAALGGAWWVRRPGLVGAAARWSLLAAGGVWIIAFRFSFFALLEQTGGQSHVAFRTAAIEPKQAALNCVLSSRPTNRPVRIVAGDWWSYWPLEYLSHDQSQVQVEMFDDAQHDPRLSADVRAGKVWFVDFVEQPLLIQRLSQITPSGCSWRRATVDDAAGNPLLEVLVPPR